MLSHIPARWAANKGQLLLQWKDKSISKFPLAWLLDHRLENWHASSNQKINPASLWPQAAVPGYNVSRVSLNKDNIIVEWMNNKPASVLKVSDLWHRSTIHSRWGLPERKPWKGIPSQMEPSSFKSDHERVKTQALRDLSIHGVHMITEMPATIDQTEAFVRKVFGPPRETFYGGMWDTAPRKENVNDTAYTYDALDCHTDTCYLIDSPGLQLFNCVAQDSGSGGKTRLVDSEMVVEILRSDYPKTFEFFRDTPLVFHHTEKGLFARVCAPVISLEFDGSLKQFRYNEYDLAKIDYMNDQDLNNFYHHNAILAKVIKSCEHHIKLRVGEMVILDNHRIMHGRTAFQGYRNLIGCYVGADDWIMRARSLFARSNDSNGIHPEASEIQNWKDL